MVTEFKKEKGDQEIETLRQKCWVIVSDGRDLLLPAHFHPILNTWRRHHVLNVHFMKLPPVSSPSVLPSIIHPSSIIHHQNRTLSQRLLRNQLKAISIVSSIIFSEHYYNVLCNLNMISMGYTIGYKNYPLTLFCLEVVESMFLFQKHSKQGCFYHSHLLDDMMMHIESIALTSCGWQANPATGFECRTMCV